MSHKDVKRKLRRNGLLRTQAVHDHDRLLRRRPCVRAEGHALLRADSAAGLAPAVWRHAVRPNQPLVLSAFRLLGLYLGGSFQRRLGPARAGFVWTLSAILVLFVPTPQSKRQMDHDDFVMVLHRYCAPSFLYRKRLPVPASDVTACAAAAQALGLQLVRTHARLPA